ncbi:MAG TPA: protein kinase [Planctomycetota bacterium]|nr:protein kinase [Planctomycetota bacterium]
MAKHPAKCPKCGRRLEFETAVDEKIVCPGCQVLLSIPGKVNLADKVDPLIGHSLGEFKIVELLGRGGMGAVYKARQTSLSRFVAIKVLPRSLARDAKFIERFGREARDAAAITHPNIIHVHAVGHDKGFYFIAMELVEGESLGDILRREGRLAPDLALEIMKQVAAALAKAHAAGIVHRDIKPSNILLTPDGLAKLADFGLAKRADVDVSVTQTGVVMGTPLYFPPEAARREQNDTRSDLYSLGATFYHLIAGHPPFQGESVAELAVKHTQDPVPPLKQSVPGAPAALCSIIHRLLHKEAAQRYQTADDLLGALSRVSSHHSLGGAARSPETPRTPHTPYTPHTPLLQRERDKGAAGPAERTVSVADHHHPSLDERRDARAGARKKLILLGGAAAAIALVLVVVLALGRGHRGQAARAAQPPAPAGLPSSTPTTDTQQPTTDNKQPPAEPSREEPNAEIVFRNAQTMVARLNWEQAQAYLDRLHDRYSKTAFYASSQAAIEALQTKVTSVLNPQVTRPRPEPPEPEPPKPEPPKPEPPPSTGPTDLALLPNGWRVGRGANMGTQINSSREDGGACVSADGLTLLFGSGRPGGQGGTDLWLCTRRNAAEPWGTPVNLGPTVNSSSMDLEPYLSPDGLTLWFASERPGGQGRHDLWTSTRRSATEPWGAPVNLGPTVNSSSEDAGPCLSPDGLVLLLSSDRSGGQGGCDLWICTRRGPTEPWSAPANLGPVVNTSKAELAPCLSADGLTLIFKSDRSGGHGAADLWMSTRRSATEPFGQPVNLGPMVNSSQQEGGPTLSADGRTLYFCSTCPGGQGSSDLWQSPLQPPEHLQWGEWVDLFDGKTLKGWRTLEEDQFADHGDVSVSDGALLLQRARATNKLTGIAWAGDFPRENYEFTVEARRLRGGVPFHCFFVRFPVGDASCQFNPRGMNGTGLSPVDGKDYGSNETTRKDITIEDERWYRSTVRVTPGRIQAWIDDQCVADLATQGKTLGEPDSAGPFSFSVPYTSDIAFRAIRLRRLTAKPAVVAEDPAKKAELERLAAERKKRAEAEAKLAQTLKPVEVLVRVWGFAAALDALSKLKPEDVAAGTALPREEVARRLASRRDELERLAKLKASMIARINHSQPLLRKGSLLIPGINADLVKADDKGITARFETGKTELHEWTDLSDRSVQRLLHISTDAENADDCLAAGILALAHDDPGTAEKHFEQAQKLGAAIDRYLDPLAAAAFAHAKTLCAKKQFAEADAALASIEKRYAKTSWLAGHKDELPAAREAVKTGLAEAGAEQLYAQAAGCFKKSDLYSVKPLVEKLRAGYAQARAVTDLDRKPSFAEMAAAADALGQFLTVRRDGEGSFKSIQQALDAAPANSIIEIQDDEHYNERLRITKEGITLRGKKGCWPLIMYRGARVSDDRPLVVSAGRATLEQLVVWVQPGASSGDRCIDCERGPVSVRSVIAWQLKKPSEVENCFVVKDVNLLDRGVVRDSLLLSAACDDGGGARMTNARVENVWAGNVRVGRQGEVRFCTVRGSVVVGGTDCVVLDSIVSDVRSTSGDVRVENCNVFGKDPFWDLAKPGKRCIRGDPQFNDPADFDYRVKPTSPCRKKASDGGDLGCRYTPEMVKVLEKALELRKKGIIKF